MENRPDERQRLEQRFVERGIVLQERVYENRDYKDPNRLLRPTKLRFLRHPESKEMLGADTEFTEEYVSLARHE